MNSSTELRPPWAFMAVAFYGPLAAISAVWIAWRFGSEVLEERLWGHDPLLGAGLGLACGLSVVLGWMLLERAWRSARVLKRGFRVLLGPLPVGTCFVLALVSSVGEELFFRAAVQPVLTLWPTSVLFALLHFPLHRTLLLWPAFALAAGILLGSLFDRTGGVLAPTLAHFIINFMNLWRVAGMRATPVPAPAQSLP